MLGDNAFRFSKLGNHSVWFVVVPKKRHVYCWNESSAEGMICVNVYKNGCFCSFFLFEECGLRLVRENRWMCTL